MKALIDPAHALNHGLSGIRSEFFVPPAFPPEVEAAAQTAAERAPTEHRDHTDRPFVTLDPASSVDLDQAFCIDRRGNDLLLHYAIADVAWFVRDGDPLDQEAWRRGTTLYLPDGKAGLYPPMLSEGAASLLPAGPRPAVIFTVRIDGEGEATLEGAERAIVRSRAKLAYDKVRDADLPADFAELAGRVQRAEDRRGGARVDPPEQELAAGPNGYELLFRDRLASEDRNAALSLATNLAIAQALHRAGTGLFRVMPAPSEKATARLRQTARAFGLAWPDMATLAQFERILDADDPREAALMMAIRRAGGGAGYEPYRPGVVPWHAPMAATYAHGTAPLRRLADRYVVQAALAVANGRPVPEPVAAAFEALPAVMARADALSGKIERAVIDLAEAVMLQERVGEVFDAAVTEVDDRGARIQLTGLPVIARLAGTVAQPGTTLPVRLAAVQPESRSIVFEPA